MNSFLDRKQDDEFHLCMKVKVMHYLPVLKPYIGELKTWVGTKSILPVRTVVLIWLMVAIMVAGKTLLRSFVCVSLVIVKLISVCAS